MRELSLEELAARLEAEAVGDPTRLVKGVGAVESAGPGELTLALGSRKLALAHQGEAAAILIGPDLRQEVLPGRSYLVAPLPKLAFARGLALFAPGTWRPEGISADARIDAAADLGEGVAVAPGVFVGPDARIGAGCVLYPGVFVGASVRLGERCVLHPGCAILDRCTLGDRVVLHAGVVIGADGFGYVHDGRQHVKLPQNGAVEIGDDVEIGANSCVDRATTGATRIGAGSKIDNLVQVGHNVVLGEQVIVVGHAAVGGSAVIEAGAIIAGAAGVTDHTVIGARSVVMAMALADGRVPPASHVSGIPAKEHRVELRAQATFKRLPELVRELRDLRKRVAALEADRAEDGTGTSG